MNQFLAGSLAGMAATVPMTALMETVYGRLPARERYPLYPAVVTERVAEKTGLAEGPGKEWLPPAALLAHFGYGTASGAAYGLVAPFLPLPPGLRGAAYGLALFAAGYLGWLPALGILEPATRYPASRRRLLLGAHLVWGVAADLVLSWLKAPDGHQGR